MKITKIQSATKGNRDGFIITMNMGGLTENGAKFRARSGAAMRFPTTAASAEVVDARQSASREYDVDVFIPSEGFGSAGIGRPIKWMRRNFPTQILDF